MIIIIMTLTALLLSIILVITDKYINKKDKKVDKIISLLPGYNCGNCGYSGCDGMSYAILENKKSYDKCRFLKEENKKLLEEYLKKI